MSLELIKESVVINRVIGEDSAQTVIENDIIVPDVKPDISRILLLDGDTYVNRIETAQDKILIDGTILYKILYVPDEESREIKSFNTSSNFNYALDVLDARPGAKCRVKCDIEHIEYNMMNERKINVKTILKVSGKAMEESEQRAVSNIDALEDVQVLRGSAQINCYLGDSAADCTISEALAVPAGKPSVKEILRTDVKIINKECYLEDGRAVAKGELNISTLYTADDEERSLQMIEFDVPFAQSLELPNAGDSADIEVDFRIAGIQFEPAEDEDGELRVLNFEADLNLYASAYEKRNIDIVSDAYSPSVRLNLEQETIRIEDVMTRSKTQVVIRDAISVSDENPEIAEVFNVLCKPWVSDYEVIDDRVNIEGVVSNNILYLSGDSERPVYCQQQEIPFRHTVDIKGIKPDMKCDIGLDIEHCSYSMISATEVEIRLIIGVDIKVVRQVFYPLTVDIIELPHEDRKLEEQPSLVIYFSKPGDTLWKIAKKYYTTVDYIQKINNITDQDLHVPGRQVLIPKRTL